MVRRTAFEELRHSWALLAFVLAALFVMFPLPPLALLAAPVAGSLGAPWPLVLTLALGGIVPWALETGAFRPATRFFGLRPAWALTLPLAGALYGGMTLDSALRHAAGKGGW
jgi:hypothetical protein